MRHRSVVWLVMACVLALAVTPVHLHLHHVDDGAAMLHEVDLHVETAAGSHSHNDDTHILEVTPDVLTKKFEEAVAILFPLALLLLLLPLVHPRPVAWLNAATVLPRHSYHHLIPHLRAPPRG